MQNNNLGVMHIVLIRYTIDKKIIKITLNTKSDNFLFVANVKAIRGRKEYKTINWFQFHTYLTSKFYYDYFNH